MKEGRKHDHRRKITTATAATTTAATTTKTRTTTTTTTTTAATTTTTTTTTKTSSRKYLTLHHEMSRNVPDGHFHGFFFLKVNSMLFTLVKTIFKSED